MKTISNLINEVEIIDLGVNGKGFAKIDNTVIFVNNTIPGDLVDINIFRKKRNYFEANPIKFHKYSKNRTTPICDHFGICGGCKLQNIKYEFQLALKQKIVTDNLLRIGKLKDPRVNDIIPSDTTDYYRNKLEFTFSNNRWLLEDEIKDNKNIENKNALGFHIPGRFDKILNINECFLQKEPSNQIRNALREYAESRDLSFYDLLNNKGFLRNLIIRTSEKNEIMVIVVFAEPKMEEINKVMNFISGIVPNITSLYYFINTKGNDSTFDLNPIFFSGSPHIKETIVDIEISLGPKSFYQTNSKQTIKLFEIVKKYADIQNDEIVYDLYSGLGSIGLYLADKAKKVVGIETIEEAVDLARINAINNNIKNAVFFYGQVEKILSQEFYSENGKPDIVVLDPPRPGLHKNVINSLIELTPKKIIYISCNPSTQARDISLLSAKFEVREIQPVDMFPHTLHIENIILLVSKNE